MSRTNPTSKQLAALNKLHRINIGFRTNLLTGERTHKSSILFCDHCGTEWPCKTMQTLGVKKAK